MTTEELIEKLGLIQKMKCETPTLEIKSAEQGCPKHLYDTMTEYEVYSYEAYRKKYQDDVRVIERATFESLNQVLLAKYIE